jgi:hypothetical protein
MVGVGRKIRRKTMKWEYKTIKLEASGIMGGKLDEKKLDAMMNELGEQGWEISAAFYTNMQAGTTRDAIIIFKRQKI